MTQVVRVRAPLSKSSQFPGCGKPLEATDWTQDRSWPNRFFAWNSRGELSRDEALIMDNKVCGSIGGSDNVCLCQQCCVRYGLRW